MLFTKSQPKGVDIPIQRLQEALHAGLVSLWEIDQNRYNCFGRVYRNQGKEGKGYIPEAFFGGIDYTDVLLNDEKALTSFFGEGNSTKIKIGQSTTPVHLIFCVNIQEIMPSVLHRADEEIHQDVLQAINNAAFGSDIVGIEIGIDNVLREYSGMKVIEGMKFRDHHPYHCFRINLEISYRNSNC